MNGNELSILPDIDDERMSMNHEKFAYSRTSGQHGENNSSQ